jgi:hypothetical protein
MILNLDFPECASEEHYLVKHRLQAILGRYGDRVIAAGARLNWTRSPGFTCSIWLKVRWWGRMAVEGRDRDPQIAIGKALFQLNQTLQEFVDEIPPGHSHAA